MDNYVFVILRHIGKPTHHQYWEKCYLSIRKFHGPDVLIVIIDDNSKLKATKITELDNNCTIYYTSDMYDLGQTIVGCGEILPYIYFIIYKWRPYMICLHDSMELNNPIPPFSIIENDDLFIRFHWFFTSTKHNNDIIINKMLKSINFNDTVDIIKNKHIYCFGSMSTVSLKLVQLIDTKHDICHLLPFLIKTRSDRMAFERVLGIITNDYIVPSLCGNIFNYPENFMPNKNPPSDYTGILIKRWIGR